MNKINNEIHPVHSTLNNKEQNDYNSTFTFCNNTLNAEASLEN